MRSDHIAMTIDEFHRLPHRLGWKHEYWDGHAHISPGHAVLEATIPVRPPSAGREVSRRAPCVIRPAQPVDAAALIATYVAGFGDSVDYCDWEPNSIAASARDSIASYFGGARGEPLAASRVAIADAAGGKDLDGANANADGAAASQDDPIADPGDPVAGGADIAPSGRIVGAALFVRDDEAGAEGARLDLLYVVPDWRRRGVATALVSAAMQDLHAAGCAILASRYRLANAASRAWHLGFGFVETPDWFAAGWFRNHAILELERRDALGDIAPAERAAIEAEIERWHALAEDKPWRRPARATGEPE